MPTKHLINKTSKSFLFNFMPGSLTVEWGGSAEQTFVQCCPNKENYSEKNVKAFEELI